MSDCEETERSAEESRETVKRHKREHRIDEKDVAGQVTINNQTFRSVCATSSVVDSMPQQGKQK